MTTEVPELMPVRMLNEFTYCPRLAYLEWVEGEFQDNLETVQGRFEHRRVDAPTKAPFEPPNFSDGDSGFEDHPQPRSGYWKRTLISKRDGVRDFDPDDPELNEEEIQEESEFNETEQTKTRMPPTEEKIHARSLLLSAPAEGLIAKLDLLEIDGEVATPVDYKRGKSPSHPQGAWEPERVQLCAQGLILREVGYQCTHGVLYFIGSRRRVEIPFDDALITLTRQKIQQFRKAAANPNAPPPLVDSPKCPRCSLVGICLPDETNLLHQDTLEKSDQATEVNVQTSENTHKPQSIRRLMPARDDALPLYVMEQGARIGKDGERLSIQAKKKTLREVKLMDISQVSLFGNVQISSQALRELASRGVPVCYFSYGGWFQAMTSGLCHKNIDLRQKQFALAAKDGESLKYAKQFVAGKIKNCRTLLRRNLPVKKDVCLSRLSELHQQASQVNSVDSLLGLEGMAAKIYFANFGRLLKNKQTFSVTGRNRRPPTDPVNCLLSFLYAILCKELTVTLQAVGFDPMLGFMHRPRYGRPSLALDLAEEFRPLIADSTTLMLINNGEVGDSNFLSRAGAVTLTTAGRKSVIAAYERRMDSLATHPIFGYRISYRRILEVQARLLARAVAGELPEYPNYTTR
ncbi:CRISPR-associated endonuclease Cas1 [Planctomycetales bacterium 10988]|nr:CRISPR-associated endonuclease Cas1 [Planctomycetales bacterium 10988]